VEGFKKLRFASPQEMADNASGIEPGKMPPFGKQLFPLIDFCFIDSELKDHREIGFNAADFECSVIMDTLDYLKTVKHDGIFACSKE
jgi:prolyl-tRNA editing enzyme YbaK/EbsC (Cys-tRNA(Pro) deacylase)